MTPKTDAIEKHYICNNCGYSPTNRSTWCDIGCGSDYNEMIEAPPALVRQLTALTQRVAELEAALPGLVEALKNLIDYARDAANGRYEYDDPRFPRAVKAFAEAHALVASPQDTSMVVASKTPETSDKPDDSAKGDCDGNVDMP